MFLKQSALDVIAGRIPATNLKPQEYTVIWPSAGALRSEHAGVLLHIWLHGRWAPAHESALYMILAIEMVGYHIVVT